MGSGTWVQISAQLLPNMGPRNNTTLLVVCFPIYQRDPDALLDVVTAEMPRALLEPRVRVRHATEPAGRLHLDSTPGWMKEAPCLQTHSIPDLALPHTSCHHLEMLCPDPFVPPTQCPVTHPHCEFRAKSQCPHQKPLPICHLRSRNSSLGARVSSCPVMRAS